MVPVEYLLEDALFDFLDGGFRQRLVGFLGILSGRDAGIICLFHGERRERDVQALAFKPPFRIADQDGTLPGAVVPRDGDVVDVLLGQGVVERVERRGVIDGIYGRKVLERNVRMLFLFLGSLLFA